MTKLSIICACGILALVVSCVSSPRQTSSETPAQTTDPSLTSQPPELIFKGREITGDTNYDLNFAETVNQKWSDLLDTGHFTVNSTGKVVLEFELHPDGTISHIEIKSQNVGPLLTYVCEKAVIDGAPYAPWTEQMKKTFGRSMDVEYTFCYYLRGTRTEH